MDSLQNCDNKIKEIEEEPQKHSSRKKLKNCIPIFIPAIEKDLLNRTRERKKERFLDFLKARPSNEWFLKILRRTSTAGNESSSPSDAPTTGQRRRPRFRVPFARKTNWCNLWKFFKDWIKGPENMALVVWFIFVAVGMIILFLLMTGLLDEEIPDSSQRDDWSEIVNQILNALFTMMALYQHPKPFHHFVLLVRWRPGDDDKELRKVYCKNGTQKPNDRAHMMFVVILLHITCFSQYVLCSLYWGYTNVTRPDWAENLSIAVGILAPILAVVYTMYSPLRTKDSREPLVDEELDKKEGKEVEKVVFDQRIIVTSPEWIGGVFDCTDDSTVTCLSMFCTFCVFGWNMERLGFGNMYVHIITFALFCIAPFWLFAISALNVKDDTVKLLLVIAGGTLCVFGILYGGFWRVEMRKKFKLPENTLCCNSSVMTDCAQWLFCWPCSLAQEVRTANFYDIEDDGFYRKVEDAEGREVLVTLPKEGNLKFMETFGRSQSCPAIVGPLDVAVGQPDIIRRTLTCPRDFEMEAPPPVLITVEERPLKNIELADSISK